MYTTAALIDIHERTHRSIGMLLDHLETLPPEDLARSVEGFSYPTLVSQLHHLLGAERYWLSVLRGDLDLDDDAAAHQDLASLRSLEASIAESTRAFLHSLSDEDAGTPRTVTQFNGVEVDVVPAHVLLRTQTHAYQHQGEIASMTRQLGHAFPPGLDFPLR